MTRSARRDRPPAGVPLVFVDDLEQPELSDDDRHHVGRVLRVRPGAPITISDGDGSWCAARFGTTVAVDGPVHHLARPSPPITVGFALVKGGRPELVVQKLTELDVDRVIPFVAERSVVRWDGDRDVKHHARLQRVAREAAMQCRRCHLPAIEPVASFDEVAAEPGAVAAERDGPPPTLERPTVLVGPEGGWSPAEKARIGHRVGLGELVLRAETAAITAAALLSGLRSGLVRSTGG